MPKPLGKPKPPHLPFDVLTMIAHVTIATYRALLALPRFGRASIASHMRDNRHQLLYQSAFTRKIIDSYGNERWYLIHPPSNRRQCSGARYILDDSIYIRPDGYKVMYINDCPHRFDGPAIIKVNGDRHWFYNGQRHRSDGPAVIESSGYKAWYIHGKRHCDDGPAVIDPTNYRAYYQLDQLHRLDGPAIIYEDGREQYWINGTHTTKERVMGDLVLHS